MKCVTALAFLKKLKPELNKQFGVTQLAFFGSTARDEASKTSDVDIWVSLDGIATSERYFGTQFFWKVT